MITITFHGDYWLAEHRSAGQLLALDEIPVSNAKTIEDARIDTERRRARFLADALGRINQREIEAAA